MLSLVEQLNQVKQPEPSEPSEPSEQDVTMTPVKIKRLYAKYIIDAWFSDYKMGWVLHSVAADIGMGEADQTEMYKHAERYLKGHVTAVTPARAWLRTNYRNLSDDMWGCTNTERMYVRLAKLLGASAVRGTKGSVVVAARALNTTRDWKTCS